MQRKNCVYYRLPHQRLRKGNLLRIQWTAMQTMVLCIIQRKLFNTQKALFFTKKFNDWCCLSVNSVRWKIVGYVFVCPCITTVSSLAANNNKIATWIAKLKNVDHHLDIFSCCKGCEGKRWNSQTGYNDTQSEMFVQYIGNTT